MKGVSSGQSRAAKVGALKTGVARSQVARGWVG